MQLQGGGAEGADEPRCLVHRAVGVRVQTADGLQHHLDAQLLRPGHEGLHAVPEQLLILRPAPGVPGPAPDGPHDELGAPQPGAQVGVGEHPVHGGPAPLPVRRPQAQAVHRVGPAGGQAGHRQMAGLQGPQHRLRLQLPGAVDGEGQGVIAQVGGPPGAVRQGTGQGGGVGGEGAVCPDGAGLHGHGHSPLRASARDLVRTEYHSSGKNTRWCGGADSRT